MLGLQALMRKRRCAGFLRTAQSAVRPLMKQEKAVKNVAGLVEGKISTALADRLALRRVYAIYPVSGSTCLCS
ncbi:MAG: hypothetical protein OJF51_000687 [Nitrospira sp.]|nr:MAG: hypothetical protein OJF51_000687 [Nitrospira sp.]